MKVLRWIKQFFAPGSRTRKVFRWIERGAHWVGFVFGVVAVAAIVTFISRPEEKSGSQPNFAGADQCKNVSLFISTAHGIAWRAIRMSGACAR